MDTDHKMDGRLATRAEHHVPFVTTSLTALERDSFVPCPDGCDGAQLLDLPPVDGLQQPVDEEPPHTPEQSAARHYVVVMLTRPWPSNP